MTTTTYGILTTSTLDSTAADETITECTSLEEARHVYEAIKRGEGAGFGYPDDVLVASLVELEGAGPFCDCDGAEVASTHAPRCTLETWTRPPSTLAELLDRIEADQYTDQEMTDLPNFGGAEPADTHGVYSWSETNLLVQDHTGMRIVPRSDRYGVSVDNGQHVVDVDDLSDEQIERHFEALTGLMDEVARELAHNVSAPCTKRAFLQSYLQRAPADLVIG